MQAIIEVTTASAIESETTTEFELSGSCFIKAWGSVAICRTDFVNKLERADRDDIGKCCLYNILVDCAYTGARKLCADNTEFATARWLYK